MLVKHIGFTLLELVAGIAVFAIAMTIVTGLIAPQAANSVDPIFQVRSTELAQSMFNEILGKQFDENSDANGGVVRCDEDPDESGTVELDEQCTLWSALGSDSGESSRADYDDVDDYHGLNDTGSDIKNSLGQTLVVDGEDLYADFQVQIDVGYDGDFDGTTNELDSGSLAANEALAKRVLITVTDPLGNELEFVSYRSNF